MMKTSIGTRQPHVLYRHDGNEDVEALGSPNPIARWAHAGLVQLNFPRSHPMDRSVPVLRAIHAIFFLSVHEAKSYYMMSGSIN